VSFKLSNNSSPSLSHIICVCIFILLNFPSSPPPLFELVGLLLLVVGGGWGVHKSIKSGRIIVLYIYIFFYQPTPFSLQLAGASSQSISFVPVAPLLPQIVRLALSFIINCLISKKYMWVDDGAESDS
jgi:hypothetical protein